MEMKKFGLAISGFTLLEILVVVVLVGALGVLSSTAFFSLLKGASKTDIVKEIKQNGDYALSIMELRLRNATDITAPICVGTAANSLTILNDNGTTSTFQCNLASGAIEEAITGGTTKSLINSTVKIGQCSSDFNLTCSGSPNGAKTVTIMFKLQQANANAAASERLIQTFQTQVTLRNK